MIPSCKKLAELIISEGIEDCFESEITPANLRRLCEAYGRTVICYLNLKPRAYGSVARVLRVHNIFRVDPVVRDGKVLYIKVQVTYFKAWHWDE